MQNECTCYKNKTDLLIMGAGPGGYVAAFLAADKGLSVTLVDTSEQLGGVCLHRGCIPSKTLLNAAKILNDAKDAKNMGITFADPSIDINQLRDFKISVSDRLAIGLKQLCKARKVNFIHGLATFVSTDTAIIHTANSDEGIKFDKAIIATGSIPMGIPNMPLSEKILDSSAALDLGDVPQNFLVIGGGYIGLELGSVYAALGSQVTVVEMADSILPGVDKDLSRVLMQKLRKKFKEIKTSTKVVFIEDTGVQLKVILEDKKGKTEHLFDKALVSIGRRPNTANINLSKAGVEIDEKGFIKVNEIRQTTNPNVFAIGDVTGQPMLAHKASFEAHIAVNNITGNKSVYAPKAIPAVIFTEPQIAWCGITETETIAQNLDVKIISFPWAACGRALSMSKPEGTTKIIADKSSHKILGIGIAGAEAGDLISEAVLAIENGFTVEQLASAIHPHPTLSETIKECAELFLGKCAHYKA
ncbi:MAG: dihydrolipoyl dehydrogenase [Candidatus Omnitrophica bacterium]|nr:dihydrolipoyl dehydrogenase [Candidatus Omnitrophota bacterium]